MHAHAARFDEITYTLLLSILGVDHHGPAVSTSTPQGTLVAARVRLRAALGGLGITSATHTSKSAFLGSLCLVSHMVSASLGGALADPTCVTTAFPELEAAVTEKYFANIPNLANATTAEILREPFERIQRLLTATADKLAYDNVFNRITSPQSKAWLLSGQQDGATFLIAYPEFGGGLSNQQFTIIVKARLGLQTVIGCEHDMPCPACSDRRAPNGDYYNPDGTIQSPEGTHVLSCRETGHGGALGQSSGRHEALKFTLIDLIKRLGVKTAITTDRRAPDKEPHCKDLFPERARNGHTLTKKPCRGDILFSVGDVHKLLDLVISHPVAQSEPRVADTPGFAAHAAAIEKENLYYNNFAIPAGHMVPLSAETGGRLDGAFRNFLKEVVTSGLDLGEAPEPVWTKESRALFSSRLRSAHVTTSYAIARCVANSLIYGSTTIARYTVR